jgi:3-hydroxyisobutyrate dehydrogenase-like beta-hydroxyacid dehydrogenase
LGLVQEARIVHAKNYKEVSKKPLKETLKFTAAVKELDEYLKDRPKKKPGRKPSLKVSLSQETSDIQGTSGIPFAKLSAMNRTFGRGKLSGMHVKHREMSPSEIAENERAEAEFEALVLGHSNPWMKIDLDESRESLDELASSVLGQSTPCMKIDLDESQESLDELASSVLGQSTPRIKINLDENQESLDELASSQKPRIEPPISKKSSLPSIGFIGMDFFLSKLLDSISDEKMDIFFSHVDHVNTNESGFKAVYTSSRVLFSTCDLIFIGASDEHLITRVFLSCDSSHLEAISKRTKLILSSKVSPIISLEIENKIRDRGGRFLDVKALELAGGDRILLAGGDRNLFEDCKAQFFSKISTDCKFFDQRQSLALYSNLQFLHCVNVISLLEIKTCLSKYLVPEEGLRETYKLTQMQSAVGGQILDSTYKAKSGATLQDLLSDVQIANDFCDSEMRSAALIPAMVQLLKKFVADGKGGLKLDQLDGALFN